MRNRPPPRTTAGLWAEPYCRGSGGRRFVMSEVFLYMHAGNGESRGTMAHTALGCRHTSGLPIQTNESWFTEPAGE